MVLRLDLICCTLRPFREEDAVPLARLADNRRIWRNLRDRFPHPYTLEDAHAWIAHTRTLEPEAALRLRRMASPGRRSPPRSG